MVYGALLQGLKLGLGAAAPIGPVNIEIARRNLRFGFRAGFLVGCGAVSVDVTYAILSTLGMRKLAHWPRLSALLGLAGALFLAYLGLASLLSAIKHRKLELAGGPPPHPGRHYLTGLLMTLLNPMTLAFWFLGLSAAAGGFAAQLPAVCLGVFIATLAWVTAFNTLLATLRRGPRGPWLVAADVLGGLTLLWFSARSIWQLAHQYLL